MSKRETIEQVLKYWAQIGIENPNFSFEEEYAHDYIYHNIIMLGVNKSKDRILNLATNRQEISSNGTITIKESIFDEWKNYFRNNPNIDVFVDENHSYFCQFISKNKTAYYNDNHIKVYIPLDGDHIKDGAKQIFTFLTDNNISHLSKIGKNIRFDDIVIRLTNEEDTTKLLEFAKNNQFLQEGLITPSPFAYQKNGIALACDGSESYNATITSLIQAYMTKKKKQNQLQYVSYEDFYNYIIDSYTAEFIEKSDNSLERFFKYQNDPKRRENYRQIFSLIIKCQRSTFNYQDFINHYKNPSNPEKEKTTEELLIECIDEMSRKYHSSTIGINNVESYVLEGYENRLTRTNDLRYRITHSNMRNNILNILETYDMSFREYAKKVMEELNYSPTIYDQTYTY